MLEKYGADAVRYSYRAGLAMIEFSAHERLIRFVLPLPKFEREFLANIVDPVSNRMVGDVVGPQLQRSYDGAPAPLLLTQE